MWNPRVRVEGERKERERELLNLTEITLKNRRLEWKMGGNLMVGWLVIDQKTGCESNEGLSQNLS